MMRNMLRSAAGRSATTPDINRVVNGIAALRQFSAAQRLQADNDQNDGNDSPKPRSGRERAAAAFGDLVSMGKESPKDKPSPSRRVTDNPASTSPNAIHVQGNPRNQDATDMSSLQSALDPLKDNKFHKAGPSRTPNVIRGGLRGSLRGRFSARGKGGGKFGGKDSKGGSQPKRNRRRGDKVKKKEEVKDDGWVHPETAKFRAEFEQGRSQAFDPTITLDSLAGHGPVVATSSSSMAQKETVRRQTIMLGDGMPHHSQHIPDPVLALQAYKGKGRDGGYGRQDAPAAVYYPRGEDTGAALRHWANDKVTFKSLPADGPTAKAILESSLLGRYEGEAPKHVPATDTIGTIRSVLRRDGTWNTGAQRALEEKVLSLLPKQGNAPQTAAPAQNQKA